NQAVADEADTLKLVKAIKEALPEKRLSETMLDKSFGKSWPDLHANLQSVQNQRTATSVAPQRAPMELAQETLEVVRNLAQRQGQLEAWIQAVVARLFPTGAGEPNTTNALLRAIQGYQDPTIPSV